MGKSNVDEKSVYLAKGTIILTGNDSLRHSKVSGNKLNVDNYNYNQAIANFHSIDEWVALSNKFMLKHLDAYVSFDDGFPQAGRLNFDPDKMEALLQSFPEKYRNSKKGIAYQNEINAHRATANGAIAPEFALPDTNGVMVNLSSFRGKYVLIDFWASWCVWCRKANPGLLKDFNQYKSKNFTILGVSLDDPGSRDAWLKAIQTDALPWMNVSDLKGRENEVAKLYDVKAIPRNFLIDPNGRIIDKDLSDEDLEKKLAELFGGPVMGSLGK